MDKFCEDCVHNSVCQYGAMPPHTDRCNDKDTISDITPKGEWIYVATPSGTRLKCDKCKHFINTGDDKNFCPNCGCSMQESNKARKEAYEEARREAMRLDEADGTLKGRGYA